MRSSRSKVKQFIYILSILFVIGFGIFAFRGVLFPPVVTLLTIYDGMQVPAGMIQIEGKTKRVEALFIQGRQIVRSLEGDFVTEIAVFAPYTIIEIEAKDRFNKTIHKTIRLSVE
ncbi:MAG: hypothetical protein WAV09_03975 [Minisyncoccia bacterium]